MQSRLHVDPLGLAITWNARGTARGGAARASTAACGISVTSSLCAALPWPAALQLVRQRPSQKGSNDDQRGERQDVFERMYEQNRTDDVGRHQQLEAHEEGFRQVRATTPVRSFRILSLKWAASALRRKRPIPSSLEIRLAIEEGQRVNVFDVFERVERQLLEVERRL